MILLSNFRSKFAGRLGKESGGCWTNSIELMSSRSLLVVPAVDNLVVTTIPDQPLDFSAAPGPIVALVSRNIFEISAISTFSCCHVSTQSLHTVRKLEISFTITGQHPQFQKLLVAEGKGIPSHYFCAFCFPFTSLYPHRAPKSQQTATVATGSISSAAQVCQDINKKQWRLG